MQDLRKRTLENYEILKGFLPNEEAELVLPLNLMLHQQFCPSLCSGQVGEYALLFDYAYRLDDKTCKVYRLQEQYVEALHEGKIKLPSEEVLRTYLFEPCANPPTENLEDLAQLDEEEDEEQF